MTPAKTWLPGPGPRLALALTSPAEATTCAACLPRIPSRGLRRR